MGMKFTKIIVIAIIILLGGISWAIIANDQVKVTTEKKTETVATADGKTVNEDKTSSNPGSYITLADYNNDPDKYADSKKIYFFHASWCPICREIEKEINADMSKIPADVTLIKTDFDNSIDLRQEYGVTTQYTFVQVDNSGAETAQWSATSLADAIGGIKS
jgi:thiol-disulfide isomerase/thioredoxin